MLKTENGKVSWSSSFQTGLSRQSKSRVINTVLGTAYTSAACFGLAWYCYHDDTLTLSARILITASAVMLGLGEIILALLLAARLGLMLRFKTVFFEGSLAVSEKWLKELKATAEMEVPLECKSEYTAYMRGKLSERIRAARFFCDLLSIHYERITC